MTLLLAYLFFAIGCSFYCSVAEAVLLSISPSFIAAMKESRPQAAARLESLKSNIDRPLAAILSLNTIAHTVGAAGVGAQAAVVWPEYGNAVGLASAIMTLLILIFSEIIPKTIGALYWRQLGPTIASSVRWLIVLLYPLVWISEKLTKLLAGDSAPHIVTREELAAMAEIGEQQGVLDAGESRILETLICFRDIRVDDVMTPRSVIIGFDENDTVGELHEQLSLVPVSRLPVFHGKLDDVTGFVLRVDLLLAYSRGETNRPLSDFRRDIVSLPADTSLPTVLEHLLQRREQLAIVVDQYGSVVGLVTLEDVVETLLGLEIVDEHDNEVDMQRYARERWRVRAERIGLKLDEE